MNWKPFFHAAMVPPSYSSAETSEGLGDEVWIAKYQTNLLTVLQAGFVKNVEKPVLEIACSNDITLFLKLVDKIKTIIAFNKGGGPFAGIPPRAAAFNYSKDKIFMKTLARLVRETHVKAQIEAKKNLAASTEVEEVAAPPVEKPSDPISIPESTTPVVTQNNEQQEEEEDITELPMSMEEFMAEMTGKFDFKLNHRVHGNRMVERPYDLKATVVANKGPVGNNGNSRVNRYRLTFGKYFLANNLNYDFVTIGSGEVMGKLCLVALFDNPAFIGKIDNIPIRKDGKRRMREMSSFELIDKTLSFFDIEYTKRNGARTEVTFAVKPFKIKDKDAANKNFIITHLKTEKFNNG